MRIWKSLEAFLSSPCLSPVLQLLKRCRASFSMQKIVSLSPSMRSFPSEKAKSGSFCLFVTFLSSFFSLHFINFLFILYINTLKITGHNVTCEKAEFDGSRGPFVEWFDTGQVISTIPQKLMSFIFCSHTPEKRIFRTFRAKLKNIQKVMLSHPL